MAKKHSDVFALTWGEKWEGEKLCEAHSCDLKVSTKQQFGKNDNKTLFCYVFIVSPYCHSCLLSKLTEKRRKKSPLYQALLEPYKKINDIARVVLSQLSQSASMISPSPHYVSHIHHPQPTRLLPPSPHELRNRQLKPRGVVCERSGCSDLRRPVRQPGSRLYDISSWRKGSVVRVSWMVQAVCLLASGNRS